MAMTNLLRVVTAAVFPYQYSRRTLPGPGSQNLAFLDEQLNPYSPIGPGIQNRRQYWFQTPTQWQPHLIGIQGLGGLISGQFVGTKLFNSNNQS